MHSLNFPCLLCWMTQLMLYSSFWQGRCRTFYDSPSPLQEWNPAGFKHRVAVLCLLQPHVTTDFGGVTEISDPKYHPFSSCSLSLGTPLLLWWDLPIISLATKALGKWPHLVAVEECSHRETWSQIHASSGVIPTSLCWLEFRSLFWSTECLSLEGVISFELSPSVFQKKNPNLKGEIA